MSLNLGSFDLLDFDITKFDNCNVLVIGDLMIDEYLWGTVDRISPEAPVQIVSIKSENYTLGGAGNVVNNLLALGVKTKLLSTAGTGANSQQLFKLLNNLGVNTDAIIREPDRPTTKKTRIIASNQHVLRIDRETTKPVSAKTLEILKKHYKKTIINTDIVIISDYGKGLISHELISFITEYGKKYGKIILADPKGIDFTKYSGIFLMTPNKKEAAIAAGIEIVDKESILKAGSILCKTVGLSKILITCGKEGMILIDKNHKPFKIKSEARQVFDVSGAGDTVIAVLGAAIGSNYSIETSAVVANIAAGIVVGKVGTATVTRDEINKAIQQ